tara:strand:+ start:200 stop:649 length:450 start_codon:yes stop_codon:yes gene_type:complete
MNKLIQLSLLGFIILTGCKKDDTIEPTPSSPQLKTEIPYAGIWERQFEAGIGNLHTVNYYIYQDSTRYVLTGAIGNANYLMQRDTFLLDDNRFIGHTNSGQYYLMFVKNVSNDSITLYKQEINDLEEGMSINMPNDTTTQNHGWSTYHK